MNRHRPGFPCPICGGHSNLAQGRGIRCAGFTLDAVSYCTRDEVAGKLSLDGGTSPPSYMHALAGSCGCGTLHNLSPLRAVQRPQPRDPSLSIEVRDAIFSRFLDMLPLRDTAMENLMRRGLPLDFLESFGFRSLPRRGGEHTEIRDALANEFGVDVLMRCPGFHDKNGRLGTLTYWGINDGFYVPYRDELGRITGMQVRMFRRRPPYLTLRGTVASQVYSVAGPWRQGCDLWITEGGLKSVVAARLRPGLVCFGVAGQALQQPQVEVIRRLHPARVIVALDRETNPQTDLVRLKWLDLLADAGFETYDSVWEAVR